jgi:hypothetical protein
MLQTVIDHSRVAIHPWPNDTATADPADYGNASAGGWHAVLTVLIAVGVGLGVFVVWVAAVLLLSWLL